jgi:D-galactarolactone isomerase
MTTVVTYPQLQAPSGACDCHMHIFDSRFPLAAKARRKEPDATVAQYREVQRRLGLSRVVVVQPTAYGRDNRCTLDAMAQLGDGARGVVVIDDSITDAELEKLHQAGMRGVRFRMLEPPELPWELLEPMAARLANFGWHIQFQMDGRDFESREAQLMSLPCTVVIEHVGKFLEPVLVSHPGFQSLLRLVDSGRVWVKLSGAYMTSRSGPPLYSDVGALAKTLVKRAPERLVWASNWPHPLPAMSGAKPDDAMQLDVLLDWTPDEKIRHRILAGNPAALYGFTPV